MERLAFVVGVVGDLALQLLTYYGVNTGLASYFAEHGVLVAALIAGATLYASHWALRKLLDRDPTPVESFVAGMFVDLTLFQTLRIMPSLDEFYASTSPAVAAIAGGLAMALPHAVAYVLEDMVMGAVLRGFLGSILRPN